MAKATRQAFGEALVKLGENHPEIVVLDADLSKSTKSELFAKKFSNRFYEMGIAEANMIGTAAGLSFTGKIPFLCSFGCFLTGRYDTIRISVAYSQANVRLVGTHAGVGIGDDGHSQMGIEDVSLMRSLPTMGVFQPMDEQETHFIMKYLIEEWKGPAYLRLTRQNLPDLYPKGAPFQPGKLMRITPPLEAVKTKVACIATGAGVAEAVRAAERLKEKGIELAVWNAHCLKPFDEEGTRAILSSQDPNTQAPHAYKRMITVEDHSIIGGLGSCVAEVCAGLTSHPKLMKFGIQDLFGESGETDELYEKFGISGNAIANTLEKDLEKI